MKSIHLTCADRSHIVLPLRELDKGTIEAVTSMGLLKKT